MVDERGRRRRYRYSAPARVLGVIATLDREGELVATRARIGERAAMPTATVWRALTDLGDRGLIATAWDDGADGRGAYYYTLSDQAARALGTMPA